MDIEIEQMVSGLGEDDPPNLEDTLPDDPRRRVCIVSSLVYSENHMLVFPVASKKIE